MLPLQFRSMCRINKFDHSPEKQIEYSQREGSKNREHDVFERKGRIAISSEDFIKFKNMWKVAHDNAVKQSRVIDRVVSQMYYGMVGLIKSEAGKRDLDRDEAVSVVSQKIKDIVQRALKVVEEPGAFCPYINAAIQNEVQRGQDDIKGNGFNYMDKNMRRWKAECLERKRGINKPISQDELKELMYEKYLKYLQEDRERGAEKRNTNTTHIDVSIKDIFEERKIRQNYETHYQQYKIKSQKVSSLDELVFQNSKSTRIDHLTQVELDLAPEKKFYWAFFTESEQHYLLEHADLLLIKALRAADGAIMNEIDPKKGVGMLLNVEDSKTAANYLAKYFSLARKILNQAHTIPERTTDPNRFWSSLSIDHKLILLNSMQKRSINILKAADQAIAIGKSPILAIRNLLETDYKTASRALSYTKDNAKKKILKKAENTEPLKLFWRSFTPEEQAIIENNSYKDLAKILKAADAGVLQGGSGTDGVARQFRFKNKEGAKKRLASAMSRAISIIDNSKKPILPMIKTQPGNYWGHFSETEQLHLINSSYKSEKVEILKAADRALESGLEPWQGVESLLGVDEKRAKFKLSFALSRCKKKISKLSQEDRRAINASLSNTLIKPNKSSKNDELLLSLSPQERVHVLSRLSPTNALFISEDTKCLADYNLKKHEYRNFYKSNEDYSKARHNIHRKLGQLLNLFKEGQELKAPMPFTMLALLPCEVLIDLLNNLSKDQRVVVQWMLDYTLDPPNNRRPRDSNKATRALYYVKNIIGIDNIKNILHDIYN